MHFEFTTAQKILFGPGTLAEVGSYAVRYGHCALVVAGLNRERAKPLFEMLDAQGIAYGYFGVTDEPTIDLARAGVQKARDIQADMIVGMGGGSAIDAGKAIAGLMTNEGDPLDYLEVIGGGQPLKNPGKPYIAIPTTAGTGSEVTQNAVLASPEHRVKVSLRNPNMLPRLAVIDPTLTHTMPPAVTASTGLDALTQCLEPYVSNKANPMTDSLCREGMARAARSLRRAYESGDPDAREDMCVTSLFGGLALANAKLGAVHGFAAVIGGMFDAAHGAVCARLLPSVMAMNVRALQERAPDSEALRRYREIAQILTGNPNATPSDGVRWVEALGAVLDVPPLSAYGLTPADHGVVVEKAALASSMQGNPLKLTSDELGEILRQAS